MIEPAADVVIGLEIVLTEQAAGAWTAIAYPATATEVLDDIENPDRISFTFATAGTRTPQRSWVEEWNPHESTGWGHPTHQLPPEWPRALDQLVETARTRYSI
jgi:hypothetical protein